MRRLMLVLAVLDLLIGITYAAQHSQQRVQAESLQEVATPARIVTTTTSSTTTSTTTTVAPTTTLPPVLHKAVSQAQRPAPATRATSGDVWDRLAQCESGGNWSDNTGNGFYGGLQFTLGTWQSVGGSGRPDQNSREEQILRGQMLQARDGWGPWPACSRRLGLL